MNLNPKFIGDDEPLGVIEAFVFSLNLILDLQFGIRAKCLILILVGSSPNSIERD